MNLFKTITEKAKQPVDYRKQVRERYFYLGLITLLAGILSFIKESLIMDVVGCILFVLWILILLKYMLEKKEVQDEMAWSNLAKAGFYSLFVGQIIILGFSILYKNSLCNAHHLTIDFSIHLTPIVLVFVGLELISVYLFFIILEDN